MTRAELIAELERLAHTFENHPIHSDMSDTLRCAMSDVKLCHYLLTPSPPSVSAGANPDIPRAAQGLQSTASRNRDPGEDQR